MAAPPSTLPRWATGLGAQITTPSVGFQDIGHEPGTAAGAGNANWFWNLVYKWIVWLRDDNGAAARETSATLDTSSVAVFSSVLTVNGVACNPSGRIVAVGASGKISTSDDCGATWTSRTPAGGFATAFNDVIWVERLSLFVAVGTAGEIQRSNDGAAWFSSPSGTSVELLRIADDASTLMICGGNAVDTSFTVLTSPDTVAWTPRTTVNGGVLTAVDLETINGKWLLCGRPNTPTRDTTVFWSADNGVSWNPVILSTGSLLAADEYVQGISCVQGIVTALVKNASDVKRIIRCANVVNFTGWTAVATFPVGLTGTYDLISGSHTIIAQSVEPNIRGLASYDCGETWFTLFGPGFSSVSRVKQLNFEGVTGPGARKWVGLGRFGTIDVRGQLIFSRMFTV